MKKRFLALTLALAMMSALLACGLSACEAAACAVWLHGAAADRAARQKASTGCSRRIFSSIWDRCLRKMTVEM